MKVSMKLSFDSVSQSESYKLPQLYLEKIFKNWHRRLDDVETG